MPKTAKQEFDRDYAKLVRGEDGSVYYGKETIDFFGKLGKLKTGVSTPRAGKEYMEKFKGTLSDLQNAPNWQGPPAPAQQTADVLARTGSFLDLLENPIFAAAVQKKEKEEPAWPPKPSAAEQIDTIKRERGEETGPSLGVDVQLMRAPEAMLSPEAHAQAASEMWAFWKGFGKGAYRSGKTFMGFDPNKREYDTIMHNISASMTATKAGGTTFKERVVGGVPLTLGGHEITQRKPWKYNSTYSPEQIRKLRKKANSKQPLMDTVKIRSEGEKLLKSHFGRSFIEGVEHDTPEVLEGIGTLMRAMVGMAGAPLVATGQEGYVLNQEEVKKIVKSREDMGKMLIPGMIGYEAAFWDILFSPDAGRLLRAHPFQTLLTAVPMTNAIRYGAKAGNLTAAKIMSSQKIASRLHKMGSAGEKLAAAIHFAQAAPGNTVKKLAKMSGVDIDGVNRAIAIAEIANKGIDTTINALPPSAIAFGLLSDYVDAGSDLEKFSVSVAATIAAPRLLRGLRYAIKDSGPGLRVDAWAHDVAQWLGDDSTIARHGSVREASEWATEHPAQARAAIEAAAGRGAAILRNEPVELARAGVATKTSILTFAEHSGFDALTELLGPEYRGYLKPDPPTPQMKLGIDDAGKKVPDQATLVPEPDISWQLSKKEYADYKSDIISRREFEATGEELLHGTSRKFDKFDTEAAKNRYGRKGVDKFYFTKDERVALTMSDSGGFKQVDASKWDFSRKAGQRKLSVDERISIRSDLNKALNAEIKRGNVLAYVDDKGNLVKVGKFEDIPRYPRGQWVQRRDPSRPGISAAGFLEDMDIRLYSKDRWPRVIKTKVYGKSLDLTDPKKIPADLRKVLDKEGVFKPWNDDLPNFNHERSTELIRWARENGYGKIVVKDSYESGYKSTIALQEYIAHGSDPYKAYATGAKRKYTDKELAAMRKKDVLKALQDGHAVPDSILKEVGVSDKVKPILQRLREQSASFREPTKSVSEADIRKSLSGLGLDPSDVDSAVKAIAATTSGMSEADKVLGAVRRLYYESVSELNAMLSRVTDPQEMLQLLPLWRKIVKSRMQAAIKAHVILHEPLPKPSRMARMVAERAAKKGGLPEHVSYIPHGTRLFLEYSEDAINAVSDIPEALKRVPGRLVDTLTNHPVFEENIKWIADTVNNRIGGGKEEFARTKARARIIMTNVMRDNGIMLLHDPVVMGKVRRRLGRRLGLKGKELDDFASNNEIKEYIKKALDGAFNKGETQDLSISLKKDVDALVAKGMKRPEAVSASGRKLKFIVADVIKEMMEDPKLLNQSRAEAFGIAMNAHARDVQFAKTYGVIEYEATKHTRGKRPIPTEDDIARAGAVGENATRAQRAEATKRVRIMQHDRSRYINDVLEHVAGDVENLPLVIQVEPKTLLKEFDKRGSGMWKSESDRRALRYEIEHRYVKPSESVNRLRDFMQDKIGRDITPSRNIWIRKGLHAAVDAQAIVMMSNIGEMSAERVINAFVKTWKLAHTAYSPPTMARNVSSNIMFTVAESAISPLRMGAEFADAMFALDKFTSGRMVNPTEIAYMKGLLEAGVASTDFIHAEIRALGSIKALDLLMKSGKGSPGKIKKLTAEALKGHAWLENKLERGYAGIFGDGPFKLGFAYKDMKRLRYEMGKIKKGEYFQVEYEGIKRRARLKKTETGWSHKGKALTEQQLARIVGKAAVKRGMDGFHNYQRVNILLQKMRSGAFGAGAAVLTDFPTWAWKSVFNEYKGMMGAATLSEGAPKIWTNNVEVLAGRMSMAAKLAVKRSMVMGALQSTLYGDMEDREMMRRAYAYGDHPLSMLILGTGMRNEGFLFDSLRGQDWTSNQVSFIRLMALMGDQAFGKAEEEKILLKKSGELTLREKRLKRIIGLRRTGGLKATEDLQAVTGLSGGIIMGLFQKIIMLEDSRDQMREINRIMINDLLPMWTTGLPTPFLKAAYLKNTREMGFLKPETFFQAAFDHATTLVWNQALVSSDGRTQGNMIKLAKRYRKDLRSVIKSYLGEIRKDIDNNVIMIANLELQIESEKDEKRLERLINNKKFYMNKVGGGGDESKKLMMKKTARLIESVVERRTEALMRVMGKDFSKKKYDVNVMIGDITKENMKNERANTNKPTVPAGRGRVRGDHNMEKARESPRIH